ncbi:MAG: YraN family protein [Coxiella sp. (in: Bacteria)]|nr:MAG: YraN family protein [Coxiella sp. (in: g-proteobacteria)]
MPTTSQIGAAAESLALRFLKRNRLKLITRNYRCKLGEIDLIMKEQARFVFIEVRKRSHTYFGSGLASVDKHKQRRIINASIHYLQRRKLYDKINVRFDIISIDGKDAISWIKNAF